jgi:ketosteroid isomerase-like protein
MVQFATIMRNTLTLAAPLAVLLAATPVAADPLEIWADAWRANNAPALEALYAPQARVVSAFMQDAAEGVAEVSHLLATETPNAIARTLHLARMTQRQLGHTRLASGEAVAVLTLRDGSVWRCLLRLSLVFVWDDTEGEAGGWRVLDQHSSFAPFADE